MLALAAGLAVGQSAGAADCGDAPYILEGTVSGANLGAGQTTAGICSNPELPGDAWFQYTAPEDGILNLAVRGKAGRHVISVWENCPERDGADLLCREDGWDGTETIAGALVRAGTDYHIRISSLAGQADTFDLDVDILVEDGADGGGQRAGADVAYWGLNEISQFGPVGALRAYVYDGETCNLGNMSLRWGGSWQGTPSLAMNLFRLKDGRLTQIGQGFTKQACCAIALSGCGTCVGGGGSVLGAGCRDPYSSSWNASQGRLGPRSNLNAFSGAHILAATNTGNAIFKRVQVLSTDVDPAQNPGAFYFAEGVFVGSDDAANGNSLNNASYRRVVISPTFAMTVSGTMQRFIPAITAWAVNVPGVVDGIVDVPSEGRFHTAYKVTDLGGGNYRYDYAIYNLTSDRSGGSFSVPLPANTTVSVTGFNDVMYHSGEPYDNTDWSVSTTGGSVTWSSPQTFTENPNSNALRWGTMYNFWFETNRAPTAGQVTLGLFKPHTPQSVSFAASVPSAPANVLGDMNCDGLVTVADVGPFVLAVTDPIGYAAVFPTCDILNGDMNGDSAITVADISGFVAAVTGG